jgi:hypothetical protein
MSASASTSSVTSSLPILPPMVDQSGTAPASSVSPLTAVAGAGISAANTAPALISTLMGVQPPTGAPPSGDLRGPPSRRGSTSSALDDAVFINIDPPPPDSALPPSSSGPGPALNDSGVLVTPAKPPVPPSVFLSPDFSPLSSSANSGATPANVSAGDFAPSPSVTPAREPAAPTAHSEVLQFHLHRSALQATHVHPLAPNTSGAGTDASAAATGGPDSPGGVSGIHHVGVSDPVVGSDRSHSHSALSHSAAPFAGRGSGERDRLNEHPGDGSSPSISPRHSGAADGADAVGDQKSFDPRRRREGPHGEHLASFRGDVKEVRRPREVSPVSEGWCSGPWQNTLLKVVACVCFILFTALLLMSIHKGGKPILPPPSGLPPVVPPVGSIVTGFGLLFSGAALIRNQNVPTRARPGSPLLEPS